MTMTNPRIPKDKSYTVAAWVTADVAPWRADESCEWTYKREEGDLTVFAKTAKEALETIRAHGFQNLNPKMLHQTSGKLTDYLKKNEIK